MTVNVTHRNKLFQVEILLREGKTRPDIAPRTDVDHEMFTFRGEDIFPPEIIRDGAVRHAMTVQFAVDAIFLQDGEPSPDEFRQVPITVKGDEKAISVSRYGDLKLQMPGQIKFEHHGNPVENRFDFHPGKIPLRDCVGKRYPSPQAGEEMIHQFSFILPISKIGCRIEGEVQLLKALFDNAVFHGDAWFIDAD
ncbi:MAG TPA: hypothetical protein PKV09_01030, partial [Syntrophales bacterium]|nr:hypothetical protein [Syntrophales bacterium]